MSIVKAPVTTYRATLTPGNGSKSAYTELTAATPFEVSWVLLHLAITVGTARRVLVDLAIGAAGSEQVIVADIPCAVGNRARAMAIAVPLYVGIGGSVRMAVRAQASAASTTLAVAAHLVEGVPGGVATTYGSGLASTKATALDAGATPDTNGAWVQLSASMAQELQRGVLIITNSGRSNDSTVANHTIDLGIGAAAAEVAFLSGLPVYQTTGGDDLSPLVYPFVIEIPAGSRLVARSKCSTANTPDRIVEVAVIGFNALPSSVDAGPL